MVCHLVGHEVCRVACLASDHEDSRRSVVIVGILGSPAYPVKDVKDLRPAYRSAMTTTLIRTMICTLYHGFHSHHRGMALPQQACNDLVYGLRLTGAVVI